MKEFSNIIYTTHFITLCFIFTMIMNSKHITAVLKVFI